MSFDLLKCEANEAQLAQAIACPPRRRKFQIPVRSRENLLLASRLHQKSPGLQPKPVPFGQIINVLDKEKGDQSRQAGGFTFGKAEQKRQPDQQQEITVTNRQGKVDMGMGFVCEKVIHMVARQMPCPAVSQINAMPGPGIMAAHNVTSARSI